jgi:hypothetical protein
MRKMLIFLVLALAVLTSNAQGPIQPYKVNGVYSTEEQVAFALAKGDLNENWRQRLVENINNGLRLAGERSFMEERFIEWAIREKSHDTVMTLRNEINSRRSKTGNTVEYFLDTTSWTGKVRVFDYGRVSIVLYKDTCINLVYGLYFFRAGTVDPQIVYIHDTTFIPVQVGGNPGNSNSNPGGHVDPNHNRVDWGMHDEYYYSGSQYYQSCSCGYNFVLGPTFFVGFTTCPHCYCSGCLSYHYGPRYKDTRRWVDYGFASSNFGVGNNNNNNNNNDNDNDNDDNDNNNEGSGSGTPGWDRSSQNQSHPTVQNSQSQSKPVVRPTVNNNQVSKPVNSVQQKPNQNSGYTKPQNNGYQTKPNYTVNTGQKPVVTQRPNINQRPNSSNQSYRPTNVQKPMSSNQNYRPTNTNMSRPSGSPSRSVSVGRSTSTGIRR